MAEGTLFLLASNLLSTIDSPAFVKAYERVCLTREARDDLRDLESKIQTIRAVLLDAEKKQDHSAAVKDWNKRVRDVLYQTHDLFRDFAINDLSEQQIKGDKSAAKVRDFFNLNLIVSRNPIRKKVKAIRVNLLEIYEDMVKFQFVVSMEEYYRKTRRDQGSFIDSKNVIGRDEDKSAILKMLLHAQSNDVEQDLSVIAMVGIGGIGKTTLAQLVYNDDDVKKAFQNMWFACISDTVDEKQILGKIWQSMYDESYSKFTVGQLQASIRKSVRDTKFLLVLDDVWDNDRGRWLCRLHLLSNGIKGSKIIVTTRSFRVAHALGASDTHNLNGLSDDESWNLFKRFAFTPEMLNNPRWTNLGREIVKKCANVPLAIKSISSFLYTKISIQEWESFKDQELSKIGESDGNLVLHSLKLNYDYLPSDLKRCFAYCSLFPKDYVISKWELIHLWIAVGYINESHDHCTVEEQGHSHFMHFLRKSFFQVDARCDITGEVTTCKMHDLIHDLAQYVASEECITLDTSSYTFFDSRTRHLSVGYATDYSWAIPEPLLNFNPRICSFLFMKGGSIRRRALGQQFANLKFLQALSLKQLQIEYVPSYIGELKHLQYLDLSETEIINIPDSITNLFNLLTLDVHGCKKLQALPSGFRKLTNLRHLKIRNCDSLDHMPPGFGKLVSLQHLDEFKVGRATSGLEKSKLDALDGLELSGTLAICFIDDTADWDGVVECWQPPVKLQGLSIHHYEGMRMPRWAYRVPCVLTYLSLSYCSRVNCLPRFGHIPCLKHLSLVNMMGLEYIEDNGDDDAGKQDPTEGVGHDEKFFPYLEIFELRELPKLKGWSRRVEREVHSSSIGAPHLFLFPCLSTLHIDDCSELKSMPLCPSLRTLRLKSVNAMVIPQLLSICDVASSSTASSSFLESIHISRCDGLMSIPGQSLTSLRTLLIAYCKKLKNVDLAPSHLNRLENLSLWGCPELELWRENKRGVDWDSLVNLYELRVGRVPSSKRLPDFLQQRQALGKLTIKGRWD